MSALEQNTQEWHEWRSQGIGASEIAAVLGISPWKSAYQLWLEKTGQAESFAGNFHTRRGKELEAEALNALAEHLGGAKPHRGECFRHPSHPLLASLDARHGHRIYDAKCPGLKNYEAMKVGIPEYYEAQLQQQALVTEAALGIEIERMGLWVYHPEHGGYLLETEPSEEWRQRIIAAADEFWARVELCWWPEHGLAELVRELQAAKLAEAAAKARREEVEARLVEAMRSAGERKVELSDGTKAALVTRKVTNRKALEADPDWRALLEKLEPLEAQKKEIEQRHKVEGAAYVRLTEQK